jgi:hypothetical protein
METPLHKANILPDSRMKTIHTPRGMVQGPGGMWLPVFCANCGADGGLCPEENMTFMFYLCNKCSETHGQIAGVMMMPDEVFYEKLKQEQLASHGRYLTPLEVAAVVEADASPLAKLIKSGR